MKIDISVNANAFSIDDNGANRAHFNATFDGNKNLYFGCNVTNSDEYIVNKEAVDADYQEFTDKVIKFIQTLTDEDLEIIK